MRNVDKAPSYVVNSSYKFSSEKYKNRFRMYNRILRFKKSDNSFAERLWIDEEGLFDVTALSIGEHISERITSSFRMNGKTGLRVLDLCSGCGFNTICFGKDPNIEFVFAVEKNENRINMSKHNLKTSGVWEKCSVVKCDVYRAIDGISKLGHFFDVAYISPPWGGIAYKKQKENILSKMEMEIEYDSIKIKTKILPLLKEIRRIVPNIVVSLPRFIKNEKIIEIIGEKEAIDVEFNHSLGDEYVAFKTIYIGKDLVDNDGYAGGRRLRIKEIFQPILYEDPCRLKRNKYEEPVLLDEPLLLWNPYLEYRKKKRKGKRKSRRRGRRERRYR